ncbi:MAG: KH domain-containing protein [Oscillospiraceae bacterium]|nr:KH domain-containing protein [Oscillospiraceae bacterium]
MKKSQKFIAKTVEEAKKMAADAFGVPMSEIQFQVIEEPKRGLFGIGFKGNATVQATYESIDISTADRNAVEAKAVSAPVVAEAPTAPAEPEPLPVAEEVLPVAEEVLPIVEDAAPVTDETAPVAEAVPVAEDVVLAVEEEAAPVLETAAKIEEALTAEPTAPAEQEAAKPVPLQQDEELITGEPSASSLEKIEKAKAYLLSVLKEMDVEAELVVNAGSDSAMIDIVSQNSGTVIGKRGETLDALQYLTFMIANRKDKEYYRIILNSANYRERRRKTLEELAAKIAKNVLRSGRQTTLEPMNPYERRIIHSAIAEIEGVSSRSVGEEPYRKVIISSTAKPARRPGGNGRRFDRNDKRGGGRDRRGGRNDRDRRSTRNESIPSERISMDSMKTSFEKDYKRPKADDEINAGLYGKIEF